MNSYSAVLLRECINYTKNRIGKQPSSLDGLKDPWQILVGITMGLQTTDMKVSQVLPVLFKTFPNDDSVKSSDMPALEKILSPLGMQHRRAKTIIEISQYFFEYGIPGFKEQLLTIYGVGPKVATLYLSLTKQVQGVVVDSNVFRVCRRLGFQSTTIREMILELEKTISYDKWNEINEWIFIFGKQICRTKNPWCDICPISNECLQVRIKT
jgi:endonuclease-3